MTRMCFQDYMRISVGTTDKKRKKEKPLILLEMAAACNKNFLCTDLLGGKAFVPALMTFRLSPQPDITRACCFLLQVLAGTGLDIRFTFLSPRGDPLAFDLHRSDGIHMWVVTLKGELKKLTFHPLASLVTFSNPPLPPNG